MTVAAIRRRFGPRALYRAAPQAPDQPRSVPHISTGFPPLDKLLGIGGFPKGRISELVGMPTSGKTTMALKFLSLAQGQGRQVGYIDQARYFDPDYAHRCGVDLSRLVVGAPYDTAETLAMLEALIQKGSLAALVLDTLDFMWAGAGVKGSLNATLSRLSAPLARAGTVFLFVHDPLAAESPALSALAHYASVRLQVVRERWQRSHGDVRGYEARVKVLKSRFGPSGQEATVVIQFNGTVRGDGL
jgi:recombination protein RecA